MTGRAEILSRFPDADEMLARLEALLAAKEKVVLAIDGRCGSGKSLLARLLAERCGGAVVQTDDFYLPASLRTPERLSEPGGNLHYERFASEVAANLHGSGGFSYRRFSCAEMDYSGEVFVPDCRLVIVEGAYCLREEFCGLYDLRVFLTVSPAVQRRRLTAREGEARFAAFENRWIPLEERYIAQSGAEARADLVIDGGDA